MLKVVSDCRRKGYVKTLCGRRRYLPAITSTVSYAQAQVLYFTSNYTTQIHSFVVYSFVFGMIDGFDLDSYFLY